MSNRNNATARSSSDSQPRLPASFKSYRDYTDFVERTLAADISFEWEIYVWLAQSPANGQALEWYRFSSRTQDTSTQFTVHGTNAAMYKSTGLIEIFQKQLENPKQKVDWQTLFYSINCATLRTQSNPMEWFSENFGLHLNLPLDVWTHLNDRFSEPSTWSDRDLDVLAWTDGASVLDVGRNALAVMNSTDDVLPPTSQLT